MAMSGEAQTKRRNATLNNFVIEYLAEDSTSPALEGMTVVVLGLEEEDGRTEKINPTRWKYNQEIQLHTGMDELMISDQSEDTGDVAYVSFSKDELAAFMVNDHNIKLKRDFMALQENGPLLRLTFDLRISQNTTMGWEPPHGIRSNVVDTISTAEMLRGCYHVDRFRETNCEDDINEAISTFKLALELTPPDDTKYMTCIGICGAALMMRFELLGRLADIDESIGMMKIAKDRMQDSNEDMPMVISSLGSALVMRFERTGELVDIANAISSHQKAVDITPEAHANMPGLLNNLGNSLHMRFERTGELALRAVSTFFRRGNSARGGGQSKGAIYPLQGIYEAMIDGKHDSPSTRA